MSLSPSAVESLFRAGKFREIVTGAERSRLEPTFPVDRLLTIAEASARGGQLERAKRSVCDALQRSSHPNVRSRCELILGLVARDSGLFDEALQRFQTSARIAKECGDARVGALSLLMALRTISERQSIRAVDSLLAGARSLTTRAGDP